MSILTILGQFVAPDKQSVHESVLNVSQASNEQQIFVLEQQVKNLQLNISWEKAKISLSECFSKSSWSRVRTQSTHLALLQTSIDSVGLTNIHKERLLALTRSKTSNDVTLTIHVGNQKQTQCSQTQHCMWLT